MKKIKFCSLILICLFLVGCGSGSGTSDASIAQLEQQLDTLMDEKGVDEAVQESTRAGIRNIKGKYNNEQIVKYLNQQIEFFEALQSS